MKNIKQILKSLLYSAKDLISNNVSFFIILNILHLFIILFFALINEVIYNNVDIVIKYENGLRATIHLDLYGRPHEKYISVTGDKGTLEWSLDPNQIRYSKDIGNNWEEQNFNLERNDMFIDVAKEFIKVIDGNPINKCTIDEGIDVMHVIDACRISSDKGRAVTISKIF